MSSSIPQLTLFPLYPGGPQVRYNNTLAANSFYLPATAYSPQYGVQMPQYGINTTSNANRVNTGYQFDSNGKIQKSTSSSSVFDQPVGLDMAVLGGIKKTAVPATAPVIPKLYEKAAELLSISDLKMSELMAQPSFNLPSIGLGLKVTTDGNGGIDKVSINPSSRNLNPDASPLSKTFTLPNRTKITSGAIFKTEMGVTNNTATTPIVSKPQSQIAAANNTLLNNTVAPLQQTNGLQQLSALLSQPLQVADADERHPLFQQINQLQSPEQGLPVSGFNSVFNAEEARQIATTQAKLDVIPSDTFKENVTSLVNASNRQTESYATLHKPAAMDGRIPMAPALPNPSAGIGQSNAGLAQDGFNLGSSLADTTDKKGSGGYLPFQMNSNTQGGFTGGGGHNPFLLAGGFSQQAGHQQQQKKRLSPFAA